MVFCERQCDLNPAIQRRVELSWYAGKEEVTAECIIKGMVGRRKGGSG